MTEKHCPFCAHVGVQIEEYGNFRWGHAVCQNCGASGPEVRFQVEGDEEAARIEVIRAWNERPVGGKT